MLEATPVTKGTAGPKGVGGTPGANHGPDGKSEDTLEVQ
jgi:hypothetical protein